MSSRLRIIKLNRSAEEKRLRKEAWLKNIRSQYRQPGQDNK